MTWHEADHAELITHVEVRWPSGSYSCSRATLDQFAPNELTVSSIDNGFAMRVFGPGTWEKATVSDASGWPLFTFHHGHEPQVTMAKAQLPATATRA